MENQNTKENIGKILDYWYTIDFLGQDSFPDVKYFNQYIEKLKKERDDKLDLKHLEGFVTFEHTAIEQTVKKRANDCEMKSWGKITVYVGAIKRKTCFKKLLFRLGREEKRSEESFEFPKESQDQIAFAAFQVTQDGMYVKDSISLSPILYAVKQIEKQDEGFSVQVPSGGGDGLYHSSLVLENELLLKRTDNNKPYHVEIEDIDRLYNKIWDEYIKNIYTETYGELKELKSYAGVCQMFVDEKTKKEHKDDTYTGLSKNYFSCDLDMLIDKNQKGTLSKTMQEYILILYKKYMHNMERRRIDVVDNDDHMEYELYLNHILRMGNAPLGKWPSQYMPAFMQQVAINLLVGENSRQMFKENGTIDGNEIVFSVNGPPGTGKTTMLKEVVVNHIVERAAILAEYGDPDDAFSPKKFKNDYSISIKQWYKLEDDSINNYSILVASSNNAAVENISKELPLQKGILDGLKSKPDATETEGKQLAEVYSLFDVSKTEDEEELSEGKFSDIYFTEYANNLLKKKSAWGLITAALGKKANKKKFYDKVLSKLLSDFYVDGKADKNRLDKYLKVRSKFQEQYELVKKMREVLDKLGEESEKQAEEKVKKNKDLKEKKGFLVKEQEELQKLEDRLARYNTELYQEKEYWKNITLKKKETEEELLRFEAELLLLKKQYIDARERTVSVQNSIGLFARIFKTQKYKDTMKLAELHRTRGDELEDKILQEQVWIEEREEDMVTMKADEVRINAKIEKLNEEKEEIQAKISDTSNLIERLDKECKKLQAAIDKLKDSHIKGIENMPECGIVLDEKYIDQILSKNGKESAEAHVGNPWTTESYNREREKLFYYAVKLNKEFILSSTSCGTNLKLLSYSWGYELGNDKKMVKFSEPGLFKSLIQTLFLFIPVISSTFASVGSFFGKLRESGVYGLLIVDEAGQAQPYMAAGALYRARKAMVVGDPKQIEPVVTDELDTVKEAFDEEIYSPYKKKNISVQLCADLMNPFGTYMNEENDPSDWVGCPLLVHRRCVKPMFEISNDLSYGNKMKQKTLPPKSEDEANFICSKSQWIHVAGKVKDNKKHFVVEQAEKVCSMLETAFKRCERPDVFIISPFTDVVREMKSYILTYRSIHTKSSLKNASLKWLEDNIGTVHTFQGKEAKEVIFLLGCDDSPETSGAISWVNDNIVNVAVTRAKYRLYVVGNEEAWRKSSCMSLVQRYLKKEMVKSDIKDISCEV